VKGAKAAANVMLKIEQAEPPVEAVSSLFFPQAVELERGAFAPLGMAAQAVTEAGSVVAAANGVNIALDAELVADIKALIPAIEQYAKSVGVAKPAGAVTPPATVPAK
jgi:hypothetical protein